MRYVRTGTSESGDEARSRTDGTISGNDDLALLRADERDRRGDDPCGRTAAGAVNVVRAGAGGRELWNVCPVTTVSIASSASGRTRQLFG